MKRLEDIDSEYRKSILNTYKSIHSVYGQLNQIYSFDLNKTEISECIIQRLKTYYDTQNQIKELLNKRYLTAASDFFVESILFFLKLYFVNTGNRYQVHSEKQIVPRKNAIRPDISIWLENELIAIIECKTQLGWNRNGWEEQFNDRDLKLKSEYPNAKSYLVVMTGNNWGGFGDNRRLGNQYFCLLHDVWPSGYNNKSQILTPIENLLKQFD